MLKNILPARFRFAEKNVISNYRAALNWIKNNTLPEQGIIISSRQKFPYLEITGYLIPTLLEAGEYKLAWQYAEFLSYMQKPNGAFAGPDGKEYVFDSGQALRGLVAASEHRDIFKPYAAKTADYILLAIQPDGRIPSLYDGKIPEAVHMYILPGLVKAAELFNQQAYLKAAQKSVLYYKNAEGVLDADCLIHFLGYIIDGFIDMGETEFVRPFVEEIFISQKKDGSIPAFRNARWSCSVGVAQFAVIGYKLKMYPEADKAVRYLCQVQNSSGGFWGSHGYKKSYFPSEEISWANKFFLDALHLKRESFFNRQAFSFPTQVSSEDGRLKVVLEHLGDFQNKKILDAGCGKGRFALRIKERFPSCQIHGLDISEELLKEVPNSIITKKGSILNLPYEAQCFDGIFCIKALEHVIQTEQAIKELCRVLKDGGRIVIIDKNIKKLGILKITDFEQWFDKDAVGGILRRYCHSVKILEDISYDQHQSDGLFFAWIGTKGPEGLTPSQWHKVMAGEKKVSDLARKLKAGQFPVWSRPLLQHSAGGDSMLELGSGTGELCAILGIYGRIPHLVDYSEESIKYAKALFEELGISGHFYCRDILEGIDMPDNSLDWVFSSGLLEHFSDQKILAILKESARVCRKGVLSLVPNANSLFYRLGKFKMEQEGRWPYGREIPKFTMKEFFEQAGLKNIKEYSVGAYHTLKFWNSQDRLIRDFLASLSLGELAQLNQGYLLFTYGEK